MFGYSRTVASTSCCYYYTWNDASGDNGICSTGTTLPGVYSTAMASYLGISLYNWGLLEMSRLTFFALIALFLAVNKM